MVVADRRLGERTAGLRKPAVPIKTMERDAADMERRYLELLGAPLAREDAAVELQA